jgi:hypothetical protein
LYSVSNYILQVFKCAGLVFSGTAGLIATTKNTTLRIQGYMGECGVRGGYAEILNMDPEVMAMLQKSISAKLCPPVLGQVEAEEEKKRGRGQRKQERAYCNSKHLFMPRLKAYLDSPREGPPATLCA